MKQEKFWSDFFDNKALKKHEDTQRLTFSSDENRQGIYDAICYFINGKYEKALDAGAGTGDLSYRIKEYADFVVSMDLSYQMLCSIHKKSLSEDDEGVLCQSSVYNPPFHGESFDLIVASEVLQYVPFDVGFKRLFSLLKINGVMVASVPNSSHSAIIKAHKRREGMYNGIGVDDLEKLTEIDNTSCEFMPLSLNCDNNMSYKQGPVFSIPLVKDFNNANRFIFKVKKIL